MKIPKIGESIYGFQFPGNRIGELEFCTSTQEHVCKKLANLKSEIRDSLKEPIAEDCDTGKEVTFSQENEIDEKNVIIYQLVRIQ